MWSAGFCPAVDLFGLKFLWQQFFAYELQALAVDHDVVVEAAVLFIWAGVDFHELAVRVELDAVVARGVVAFKPEPWKVDDGKGHVIDLAGDGIHDCYGAASRSATPAWNRIVAGELHV